MDLERKKGKIFDKAIGLHICGICNGLGWTLEKLAEEAKVSRTTVYNVRVIVNNYHDFDCYLNI